MTTRELVNDALKPTRPDFRFGCLLFHQYIFGNTLYTCVLVLN